MAEQREKPIKIETIDPAACTVERRLEVLQHVPFFASLPAEAIRTINAQFHARGFMPDEMIYMAGDQAMHLYVVAIGKVKLIRHTMSGQDIALDFLTPGDFFGSLAILGDQEYSDTAQAQTPCCVLEITASEFLAILESFPQAAMKVLERLSARLRDAQTTIQQLSASPVDARVAATLTHLASKVGEQRPDGIIIQMPLSRQDLAEMTGTTTESVSRVMSQFRKEGIIQSGREWVRITKPERLQKIATGESE